jgi:hypothetical protein
MDARNTYLQSTTEFSQTAPNLTNPNAGPLPISNGNVINFHVEASNETEVWVGYRHDITHRFTKLPMYDDGLHDDGGADDGVYGAQTNAVGTYVQFYYYAQNNNAGIFLPARAEHEFLKVLYSTSSPGIGDVVINEFLASNSVQHDEYAQTDDWIELYNNTNQVQSLDSLYLTDDLAFPAKWAFPSNTSIAPHDFLMIWADDDQWQVIHHANFNLSSFGGSLYLTNGSMTLDQITYGSQTADISYGRFPNGTGAFQPMSTTFHADNNGTIDTDESSNEIMAIYPNPFHDQIQIQSTQPIEQLAVYDAMGHLMHVQKNTQGNIVFETESWAAGLYFITMKTSEGKQVHKKVMKQ